MKIDLKAMGYLRVGVAVPELYLADVERNLEAIQKVLIDADARHIQVLVFPELSLTGYSCGDLFFQDCLQSAVDEAIVRLIEISSRFRVCFVVGFPLRVDGLLFNCAGVFCGGRLLGIVTKSLLPNRLEFYEQRWFSPAHRLSRDSIAIGGSLVPIGADLVYSAVNDPLCVIGVEICEDLWAVEPPSGKLALSGATVLLNLSASNELLGKHRYRTDLIRQQSARCLAAYAYASAGIGESSTDLVFSGAGMIAENGSCLAEVPRFGFGSSLISADIDLEILQHERLLNASFAAQSGNSIVRTISFHLPEVAVDCLQRVVSPHPFVPFDLERRTQHCEEIFALQCGGLTRRLRHLGTARPVIGISGGLDSTLALLVCVKALHQLGRDASEIVAVTMPGFGTTKRTRSNAVKLAEKLGVTLRTIAIGAAVRQHFKDIGHPETLHDITYENAQARERTQILMDVANQCNGIVIGTGDLSEMAMGWCTYNGDHMSMYAVNCGVPKTLVRYLVEWVADTEYTGVIQRTLKDISETPISPELLPVGKGGELVQQTESTIGPYELHDFFLFHMMRYGFRPEKIFRLAMRAFEDVYSSEMILDTLELFYRRFFANQFKRSAVPDGPKIGSVSLSPRGDWRMPSDAFATLWIDKVKNLRTELMDD
jgi:NAD+ synthase (glutamine-hydrolysing)